MGSVPDLTAGSRNGYQIGIVVLKDGRRFPRSAIQGGFITSVDGNAEIPFADADIETIVIDNRR